MLFEVAEKIDRLLDECADLAAYGISVARLLNLIEEVLGDDYARFPDGRMLIWDVARHDGYNIPEYPMAGCGDVKEFLADEDARNVPDWYEKHLGIPREVYNDFWEYELVMVRNRTYWRRVFLVPARVFESADEQLLAFAREWLKFALGAQSGSDDLRLFKR